jgi:hypothetical protein
MAQDPQKLFEAVRQACLPATWSRGIELTRAEAVVGEGADDDEVVFHVSTRGGMFCPKISIGTASARVARPSASTSLRRSSRGVAPTARAATCRRPSERRDASVTASRAPAEA